MSPPNEDELPDENELIGAVAGLVDALNSRRSGTYVDQRAGWSVEVHVEQDGVIAPRITGIAITPDRDSAKWLAMTSNDLREMPWGEIFEKARQSLSEDPELEVASAKVTQAVAGLTHRGVRKNDGFYALRALEYLNLVRRGSRRPVDALAERHDVKRDAAANWLKQARKRGLLESASPGKSGGFLTAKAVDLLAVDDDG